MIEPMKAKQSLKAAELQDGDIICFQLYESKSTESRNMESSQESISQLTQGITLADDNRSLPTKSPSTNSLVSTRPNPQSVSAIGLEPITDARLWYDFLLHKRIVTILPHPTRTVDPESVEKLVLTLTTKHSYDSLSAIVGDRLGVNPTHLRFWTVNATTNQPKTSVKRGPHQTLQTILMPPYSTFSNNNQRADALFYELLDMSLSELDTKKTIKVIWVSEGTTKEVSLGMCSRVSL
jgi:ubiquitin carboxyl-terminal hydrolase 7